MTWFSCHCIQPCGTQFHCLLSIVLQDTALQTHAQADSSTNTFSFHDPLSYQASAHKADLPGYMNALTGPD